MAISVAESISEHFSASASVSSIQQSLIRIQLETGEFINRSHLTDFLDHLARMEPAIAFTTSNETSFDQVFSKLIQDGRVDMAKEERISFIGR